PARFRSPRTPSAGSAALAVGLPSLRGPRAKDGSPGAGADARRERAAEGAPDAAHRLPGPVLVLDQREADVVVPVLAEPDAGRDSDLRVLQQELRELERAHRLEGVGYLGPHEHRRLRLRDVPPDPIEPFAQRVAPLAVRLADLVHVRLGAVQRLRGRD